MTHLCLPRPEAAVSPTPVPPRGMGAGEGSASPVGPCVSPWGPSWAQVLDSVLGLGALGLTIRAVFSTTGPALLLLLVSFLAFDMLRRPAGPTWSQHTHLTGGQSQGAGEGPGQQDAPPAVAVSGRLSLQEALLLLLLGTGLLLGARGVPLALLALAFCLHPWT
ncbi:uncharacterized protein C20orf141 homolog [Cervus elaphus]|uniref:uncharacterized protein C20orf141 homolog n=1 Tax=Cervus canadensis TaxID=1574408 RepID=UPI0018BD7A3A|nr:uncharacterized protein C20orf141 homolog [Cervus canadensis]XP_043738742.1 uncharacterized protein C20orf141 homolog [Cervus elaphus]